MKKFIFILLLIPQLAFAQAPTRLCVLNPSNNSCVDVSSTAPLPTSSSSGATASQVQGNVAGGTSDAGTNPVKIGGLYSAVLPTLTDGQRGDAQLTLNGQLMAASSITTTAADGIANGAGGTILSITGAGRYPFAWPLLFNGSTWDRQYVCNSTAVVNVTAGATTEIVPLTASQIIRVCSFSISMSAAGTAAFVYGTGTNCGTGTTSLTGAMPLATGVPLAMNGGTGNVFRGASANALCVAAVTGNVVGFVTYAKY